MYPLLSPPNYPEFEMLVTERRCECTVLNVRTVDGYLIQPLRWRAYMIHIVVSAKGS